MELSRGYIQVSNYTLRNIFRSLAVITAILVAGIILLSAITYGGTIDGRISPAVEPMLVTGTPTVTEDGIVFYGSSSRLRSECNFVNINWYMGNRGSHTLPITIDVDTPIVRADGTFNFGPWTVDVYSVDILINYTYANIVHSCKTFGVNNAVHTVTRFWN